MTVQRPNGILHSNEESATAVNSDVDEPEHSEAEWMKFSMKDLKRYKIVCPICCCKTLPKFLFLCMYVCVGVCTNV